MDFDWVPEMPSWLNWIAAILGIVASIVAMIPILRNAFVKGKTFIAFSIAATSKYAAKRSLRGTAFDILHAAHFIEKGRTEIDLLKSNADNNTHLATALLMFVISIICLLEGLMLGDRQLYETSLTKKISDISFGIGVLFILAYWYQSIETSVRGGWYLMPFIIKQRYFEVIRTLKKVGYSDEEAHLKFMEWTRINEDDYLKLVGILRKFDEQDVKPFR